MDWAVIRILYKDLSPGLHGKAERHGGRTTVYLLPGLTGRQRKAALRRLRQEASRGYGPALPLPKLTLALGASRAGQGLRSAAAVIRLHPAGSVLPVLATGALMAVFVLASVSVRIVHVPGGSPTDSSPAAGAAGPAGAAPAPPGAPGHAARSHTGSGGAGNGAAGSSGTGGRGGSRARLVSSSRSSGSSADGTGAGAPAKAGNGTATSGASSATATGTGTASASPTGAGPSSPGGSQPTGTGSPGPSPSSAPSPSSGDATEVCVGLGSIGGCLGL
jgi:hypothetical protein